MQSIYEGLFVKASGSPDMNIHYSEGLIEFPAASVYVSAGSVLITVVATAGTSVSGSSPAATATALMFNVNIDGDGAQTITVDDGGTHTGAHIASVIQAAIRALTANNPANQASINAVTCAFTTVYTITSGSTGSGSSVVVTGAGASTLKLGVANGGTEASGISSVAPSSMETVGVLQVDSTGAVSAKWAAPVAAGSGLSVYPTPDAGKAPLALLFTPAVPLNHSTSSITNANLNNRVTSTFGGR